MSGSSFCAKEETGLLLISYLYSDMLDSYYVGEYKNLCDYVFMHLIL